MEQPHKISRAIQTSTHIGNRDFPSREDYASYFMGRGIVTKPEELWANNDLVQGVQRHWHTSGQNGCVFAQTAAVKYEDVGWHSLVNRPTDIEDLAQTVQSVFEAVDTPELENLSLLFPEITEPDQLVQLVKSLPQISDRFLLFEREYQDRIITALRMRLNDDGVLSWIVGFGPFDFLPVTRQAPVTELAIRTKPKPNELFHRLTNDRTAAHLADVPLGVSDRVMESLWTATRAQTGELLTGDDRTFSSAKVTYAIPTELWQGN